MTMAAHAGDNDTEAKIDLHVEATYRLTEALVEVGNQMRRRIDLLSEIVFEIDTTGHIVYLNPAWKEALGFECADCLGHELRNFVVEEDLPLFESAIAGAATRSTRQLIRMRQSSGAISWMEMSISPIHGGGSVGAIRDVTQQKRAQDEVAKLSLVASFTDNLVIITDRNGRTEWVNEAFTKRTGFVLADMLGRRPGDLLQGPDTDLEAVAQIGRNLREGKSFSAELLNYSKALEPYWVQFHVTPVHNVEGEVERFISIQTDSTRRHREQQVLEDAKIEAERANRAKSDFLAVMSHEIRTPMNGVLGMLSALEDTRLEAQQVRLLDVAKTSAQSLLVVLNDMLDFSKIEAGRLELEQTVFDPQQLVASVVELFKPQASSKSLALHYEIAPDLTTTLLGDAGRLRQIILNLVSNALKFTAYGEVIIRARNVGKERDGRLRLRIEVSDTGIGIPPESRNEVFTRFSQLDRSYARRFGGTGIGLAISRSLAELMGGEIGFDSRAGAGTTFWLEVPVALGAVTERKANLPTSSAVQSLKILVVEDNATNQLVARMILSQLGHRVDIASDGLEALAAVSQHNYSLVMMDVSMPTMDGLEATRRMRSLGGWSAEMPIIAMTALATPEDRRLCLEAGMNGFVSKPVTREKLEAVIWAVVTPWAVNRRSESGDPAIENGVLVQLAEDIGVEGVRKVLVTFVNDLDQLGQIALDSAQRGDVAEFSRTAHSLKGISSMVGATRLQAIASRLERDARSGTLLDVMDACNELALAVHEARANVCDLLGRAGSPAS